MFSAVNSPRPRVVFDMVVSGAAGFVSFVLVGALRAALSCSGPVVCKAGQQLALAGCPVRAAKWAARMSRPAWVVLPGRRLSKPDGKLRDNSSSVARMGWGTTGADQPVWGSAI